MALFLKIDSIMINQSTNQSGIYQLSACVLVMGKHQCWVVFDRVHHLIVQVCSWHVAALPKASNAVLQAALFQWKMVYWPDLRSWRASAAAALLGINSAPTSAESLPDARQQSADMADNSRPFIDPQIWTRKIFACKILMGMYYGMVPHPVAVLLL